MPRFLGPVGHTRLEIDQVQRELPEAIEPAYDGLVIELIGRQST